MPFNINSFKSNGLVYGGARPALFNVRLTPPPGIGIDNISAQKFEFVCRSAELPAASVGAFDVPYFGRKIKISGDRTFADWQVNIMNDEDFAVRAMFEKWSNALNRLVSNVRDPVINGENYKTDLTVIQYSKDGGIIRSYDIIGAFPTEIGAIALDWDTTNAFETFPVTFAYDYWVPAVEASDKKAGGVNTYLDQALTDGSSGPG
jgi:hypothetical protein